jgi:cyclopropane fatty-acyl-phospholipid synthase-like methyltransferase
MKYNHPRFLYRRYEVMRRIKKGDHFLEIGPGNLSLALELLTKFNRGTLMDFNTTDVEEIFNKLAIEQKRRLKLIIADFSEYNQFDEKFNCIIFCEVLEHIENDRAFLTKTNNLLVKGGQLILSVPSRQKFWAKDDEIAGHYRRYEKQDLFEKLTQAGYSEVKIASYGFPFINITRLIRITLAKKQYREKSEWDKKKQTQQSAFLIKRNSHIEWIAYLINKYTFYPINVFASLFNNLDLSEGYVATAIKANP